MASDTVFDLASLSKVVGTTSVVAWLYENGYLDLDEFVCNDDLLGVAFAQGGQIMRLPRGKFAPSTAAV